MKRTTRSGPIIQIKADQLIADLLGAENETRARVRGHSATSFVVPSAGPAGSSLGEQVASPSPLYKKKQASNMLACMERKTRLELATPTLARLCSTN